MSARTTNSAVGSPRTGRARGSASASTGTGESVDPLVAPPLGTMPLTSGPRVDSRAPASPRMRARRNTERDRRIPTTSVSAGRDCCSVTKPAVCRGSIEAPLAIELDETEQRPARDAERDARCCSDMRASSPAGSSRLLGTTNERPSRPRADFCFAMAEQSSREACPAPLPVVQGWERRARQRGLLFRAGMRECRDAQEGCSGRCGGVAVRRR
jgi:hypothetical protein